KRSLLVVGERRKGIVQVRTVVLIALLAVVRKLIIIEPTAANGQEIFALAATILALGAVYWLVGDQGRRRRAGRTSVTDAIGPTCRRPSARQAQPYGGSSLLIGIQYPEGDRLDLASAPPSRLLGRPRHLLSSSPSGSSEERRRVSCRTSLRARSPGIAPSIA